MEKHVIERPQTQQTTMSNNNDIYELEIPEREIEEIESQENCAPPRLRHQRHARYRHSIRPCLLGAAHEGMGGMGGAHGPVESPSWLLLALDT